MKPIKIYLLLFVLTMCIGSGCAIAAELERVPDHPSQPMSVEQALQTYKQTVNQILDDNVMGDLRRAAREIDPRYAQRQVVIRVSDGTDPRVFDYFELPGDLQAVEFTAAYIALLDAEIEAALMSKRLHLSQEHEEYLRYLQRLTSAGGSVIGSSSDQRRGLNFHEFAGVSREVRDDMRADPSFHQQRNTLLNISLVWTAAHLYAHRLLEDPSKAVKRGFDAAFERRADELALQLLLKARLLGVPVSSSLALFVTAERGQERPDYHATQCRAFRIALTGLPLASELTSSESTPAVKAQLDAQRRRAIEELEKRQRAERCEVNSE